MRERLRRAGLRAISPVVDITNYVMLETGQPMHGYDLSQLAAPVVARMAKAGEKLTLLDGKIVDLSEDVLVIADQNGPLGLAGIMGGEKSGVSDSTTDVFFESAYFAPTAIAGRARRFGMHTDASHRFERGVDPAGQVAAIERATRLLVDIAEQPDRIDSGRTISITREQLDKRLGAHVSDAEVSDIFERLGFEVSFANDVWTTIAPSHRFDMAAWEDLAEEVARVYGYNRIAEQPEMAVVSMPQVTETRVPVRRVQDLLVDRGFQEVITYSFVDPALHDVVCPGVTPLPLTNPISAELAVMRSSLWPGLISTLQHNLARQQERVLIFETGLVFEWQDETLHQPQHVAFAIAGARLPERWSHDKTRVDFHDATGHIEALLALRGARTSVSFEPAQHDALHPGQSANIMLENRVVGCVGVLHPARAKQLDLPSDVVVAQLDIAQAFSAQVPLFESVPRFPATRRDLSVLVPDSVKVAELSQAVRAAAGPALREVRVFDVYRGKGIDSSAKSVSFGLILQDSSRTLNDTEADAAVTAVMAKIKQDFDGTIRD
jgi:phenylalanyl-tRNA synthetase beta chain